MENKYTHFTKEWYLDIGVVVTTISLFSILSPFAACQRPIVYLLKTCADRGGRSCDSRKTSQILQSEYEQINKTDEFFLEGRYSNVLKVMAITFLYSPGMPIMYLFSFLSFFFQYWVDKVLLVYFYAKPPMYDEFTALKVVDLYKLILLMHVTSALFMYGYTPILRGHNYMDFFSVPKKLLLAALDFKFIIYKEHDHDGTSLDFFNIQIYALFLCVLLFVILATLRSICYCMCGMCCPKSFNSSNKITSSDFYSVVTYATLRHELVVTMDYIKKGKQLYKETCERIHILNSAFRRDAMTKDLDWRTLEFGFVEDTPDAKGASALNGLDSFGKLDFPPPEKINNGNETAKKLIDNMRNVGDDWGDEIADVFDPNEVENKAEKVKDNKIGNTAHH